MAEKSVDDKRPGQSVRGSKTGRPIMVLFDVLGQRWTLRILWELREGPLTFRALQAACENASPTVINTRLKALRGLALVTHTEDGYTLSPRGLELNAHLAKLDKWSNEWAADLG